MLRQLWAHLSPEVRSNYRALDRLICSDLYMHFRKQQLKSYYKNVGGLPLNQHTLQMFQSLHQSAWCPAMPLQCDDLVTTCVYQWL